MAATIACLLLTVLVSQEGKPSVMKFQGKEGIVREYQFSYSNTSIEAMGKTKKVQDRKTLLRIVERILSVDADGSMDIEVDFDKVKAYISGKKQETPFFPSISFKMNPTGDIIDIKPVNPFDVAKGSAFPPYKEYMGSLEFPRVPIGKGDSWQYETKIILPFSVYQNVMVTATFKGEGDFNGKKCAIIATRHKAIVANAPSPLGLFITGTSSRKAESCFDIASGEMLTSKGETTYSIVSTRAVGSPSEGPSPQVSLYLEENFTTSLIKKRVE